MSFSGRDKPNNDESEQFVAAKIIKTKNISFQEYSGHPVEKIRRTGSKPLPPHPTLPSSPVTATPAPLFSTTPTIMSKMGYPPKARAKNVLDFDTSSKYPQKSFHEIDVVKKKSWALYIGDSLTYYLDEYPADSYFLERSKLAPWHLSYLDESKCHSEIDLNTIPSIKEILKGKTKDQLSEEDKNDLKIAICEYRKAVQKKKSSNPTSIYFFKHSKHINSEMTWLEAVCGAYYRFIAPYHVSSTKAIYDENGAYVAACSRGIKKFKSTREDPLTNDDFGPIEVLEKGLLSIAELDAIDRDLIAKKVDLDDIDPNFAFKGKLHKNEKSADHSQKTFEVSISDIRKYRIRKGLAIGLTTSYINNEDDCHKGNISKYGQRIDFDMSWWNITYNFKPSGIVDMVFRYPKKDSFTITEYDIRHFPNTKDSNPWYWPTSQAKSWPEAIVKKIANFFSISQNDFTTIENTRYSLLEQDKVFNYHKYATLLKYILTTPDMYRNIFKLHAPQSARDDKGNLVIDLFTEAHAKQIQTFRSILTKMPEFLTFLQDHGRDVLKNIMFEFEENNKEFQQKIVKIDAELNQLQTQPDKFMQKFLIRKIYQEQIIPKIQISSMFDIIFKETHENVNKVAQEKNSDTELRTRKKSFA